MPTVFEAAKTVPIKDVISSYVKGDVSLQKGNMSCPFHTDNKPSFHVYENNNSFHCFSCKADGSVIDLVAKLNNWDPESAAADICKRFNVEYTQVVVDPGYKNYVEVYKHMAEAFNMFASHYGPAVDIGYWKLRKLDNVMNTYLLGYCPENLVNKAKNVIVTLRDYLHNKFPAIPLDVLDTYGLYFKESGNCVMHDRWVIPIKDAKGNVVAFAGRTLSQDPEVPKYINSVETPYFKKNSILFNYDMAKRYPFVYVVEGYMDALSLIAQDIPNVVASMGTSFNENHISMFPDKIIVLSLDNDKPGKDAMVELIEKRPDRLFRVLELKGYKDFNEAHMAGVVLKPLVAMRNAIYGTEFVLHRMKETLDLSLLFNREAVFQKISTLSKYHSPVARDYFSVIMKRMFKGKRADGGV